MFHFGPGPKQKDYKADVELIRSEIGIIVDGNKSALGASAGQYVILQNSTITGKTDGLYKAASAIPANTAITGSYLTAVSGGLGAEVATLNSKFTTNKVYGTESVDVPSSARDLTVFVRLGTSGGLQNLVFTFSLPSINADTTGLTLTQGYYLTASTYGFCQITASANNKISIVSLNIGGTEYRTTSQVTVFYKA